MYSLHEYSEAPAALRRSSPTGDRYILKKIDVSNPGKFTLDLLSAVFDHGHSRLVANALPLIRLLFLLLNGG
jgi:hypothetical protein